MSCTLTHGAFLGKVEPESIQLLLFHNGLLDPLCPGDGQFSEMCHRLLEAL